MGDAIRLIEMFCLPQVIQKQQRVIKRLLKKCHGAEVCGTGIVGENGTSETDAIKMLASDVAKALGAGTGERDPGGEEGKVAPESRLATELLDGQNDSDSAIMLEDHITEVGAMFRVCQ